MCLSPDSRPWSYSPCCPCHPLRSIIIHTAGHYTRVRGSLHSLPGLSQSHHACLLAHDVGKPLQRHCHGYQRGGSWQGAMVRLSELINAEQMHSLLPRCRQHHHHAWQICHHTRQVGPCCDLVLLLLQSFRLSSSLSLSLFSLLSLSLIIIPFSIPSHDFMSFTYCDLLSYSQRATLSKLRPAEDDAVPR